MTEFIFSPFTASMSYLMDLAHQVGVSPEFVFPSALLALCVGFSTVTLGAIALIIKGEEK